MTTGTAYPASGYHTSFGARELRGRLTVTPEALLFESEQGNCGIPLERLLLARGPGGVLHLTDAEQPEWFLVLRDGACLSDPILNQRAFLKGRLVEVRRDLEGRRNLRLAVGFLAACAALGIGLWLASGWMLDWLTRRAPLSWDRALGQAAQLQLERHFEPLDDPVWTNWLAELAKPLLDGLSRSGHRFELQLVDHPMPNAFALPGGRILVLSGLLKGAKRPEEVAGVLAHEIAHVTRRHGLRRTVATFGPRWGLRLVMGDEGSALQVLGDVSHALLNRSFSRDQEREADELAFRTLLAARIDPRGLGEFLRRLEDLPEAHAETGRLPALLSSHPPTPERSRRLDEFWRTAPRKPTWIRLPALPQHAPGSGEEEPGAIDSAHRPR